MIRTSLIALGFALTASAALAGPQYVDETGFAVSGYDVVSYFALDQAPIGDRQPEPAKGNAAFTAEHNGATFAFASAANRDAFLADPDRFAPAYDGHCAFGVAKGSKVPANPTLWRIVDDTLYLNITRRVAGTWERDIAGHVTASEANWPDLEPQAASADTIPRFSSAAPLTN